MHLSPKSPNFLYRKVWNIFLIFICFHGHILYSVELGAPNYIFAPGSPVHFNLVVSVLTPILPVLAANFRGVSPVWFSMSSSLSFGCSRAAVLRMRSYILVTNSVFSLELSATTTRACSTVLPCESVSFEFARWYSLSIRKSTMLGWLVQAARDRGSSPGDSTERDSFQSLIFTCSFSSAGRIKALYVFKRHGLWYL